MPLSPAASDPWVRPLLPEGQLEKCGPTLGSLLRRLSPRPPSQLHAGKVDSGSPSGVGGERTEPGGLAISVCKWRMVWQQLLLTPTVCKGNGAHFERPRPQGHRADATMEETAPLRVSASRARQSVRPLQGEPSMLANLLEQVRRGPRLRQ